MPRQSKIWPRKGRGFWTTVRGRQIHLGNTLREAERNFHLEMAKSDPLPIGRHSTPKLVDFYLGACVKRVADGEMRPATLERYREHLDSFATYFRRLRPEELRPLHLDGWLDGQNWNPSTKALAIRIAKGWSRWCARKGYLDTDRLGLAEAPMSLIRDAADPADLLALEAVIGDPHFLDFFRVLYDTGCRPGELGTLEADRIGWDTATAMVRGKMGLRMIGLTARAVEVLRRNALVRPAGLVLLTAAGMPWRKSVISYHWCKWRRKAGLPETLVAYHCRHDLWRRWHAAGISDIVISRQLGHVLRGQPSLNMLNLVYAHPSAMDLADAARLAAQSIKSAKRARIT